MDLLLGKRLRELPGPILITGHTGFKGAWLTFLLEYLGVPVVGYSLPPEATSLYARANREGVVPEAFADIRNIDEVLRFMSKHRPSAVIHMAAQPLVLESYKIPRETFETNVLGTVNILDAAFKTDSVEAIVVVTTDKVYRNNNSGRAFDESDALAGKDPYSASKVGTEAAVAAWQQISKATGGPEVISVRAGNVIGGGDLAEHRILPDLIRGFVNGKSIRIRNPESTRPWQHVLDPLTGYLMALEAMLGGQKIQALNFGPDGASLAVKQVFEIASKAWGTKIDLIIDKPSSSSEINIEAVTLGLDSNLARSLLGWSPSWSQEQAVVSSINWWKQVLNEESTVISACQNDIDHLFHMSELGQQVYPK